jgi:hypothetical protein
MFCGNLSGSIAIPEGLTEIQYGVFSLTNITGVTIPESVTTIGNMAFGGCTQLATVKLPSHTIEYLWEWDGKLQKRRENTYPEEDAPENHDAFGYCPKLSLATRKIIEDSGYKGIF